MACSTLYSTPTHLALLLNSYQCLVVHPVELLTQELEMEEEVKEEEEEHVHVPVLGTGLKK